MGNASTFPAALSRRLSFARFNLARGSRKGRAPDAPFWKTPEPSLIKESAEVLAAILFVAVVGWYLPLSYHTFGEIYLLTVIALSLRVSRWPVIGAAVASAVAWNYVFIPPRLSFAVLDLDDTLMLGTYFVVAVIGGQLTTRLRTQAGIERRREQEARALLHLTRAIAAARTLDEAASAALRQADELFAGRTALILIGEHGELVLHEAGSFEPTEQDLTAVRAALRAGQPAGRFTAIEQNGQAICLPLRRADDFVGVLLVCLPRETSELSAAGQDLMYGFAAQVALLIERERLRAANDREKLSAESDRLHRTLLDSVSHELKTPLAVLRSAAENLVTADETKRQTLTDEIRTATRRLDRLVGNLLSQSRVESGGLRPQMDWCDVRDLIGASRKAVGEALAGREVKLELSSEMPLWMADPVLMEQILSNLLLNAALHTPEGLPIHISAGVNERLRVVYVAIDDAGPGIPEEVRETLFQKFSRGNSARPGGVGLGLSIVRGFVVAQGGEVSVERSPLGGARFTVSMPYSLHSTVPSDER